MSLPRVSLQALEAFERVAESGSVQDAARDMKLSISSVSHQIARLEDQLGAVLLDRSSRPFTLTREGRQTLHHLSKGLLHLRRATSETVMSGLLGARSLRIGIVEDFESNVTPDLAVLLARQMPNAALSIRTILSHEAEGLLRKGQVDVAIATGHDTPSMGISSEAVLHDPFVLAYPKGMNVDAAQLLAGRGELPFLRFERGHMIGMQVEAHLARCRVDLPQRFSFDSAQSMMAVVAAGEGWAIMTPLGFMRAKRFADRVMIEPMTIATFSRTITIAAQSDFDPQTKQAITSLLREVIRREVIEPACQHYSWLSGSFMLGQS